MTMNRRAFSIASASFAFGACAADQPEVDPPAAAASAVQPAASAASAPEPAASAASAPPPPPKPVVNPIELPSLSQALMPHFLFGSAITPGQVLMGNAGLIQRHFSVVVAENAMKPEELAKRGEGKYSFQAADDLVNFAVNNGIKVRGHTLIWHNQAPPWFFDQGGQTVSRDVLIARMRKYIKDVVTHFKGRVYAWDVVNEAFSFNESNVKTDTNGMRMSRFREIIGPDYLEIAFQAAAEADPEALLFYNDYETHTQQKVDAISKMVRDFKSRGIKIDGIGHQSHYTITYPAMESFESAIVDYSMLGVTQHITEMDIALNGDIMKNEVFEATPELLDIQGKRYGEFFKVFVKHRDKITSVLVWGIDDNNTWLKSWPMKRFEAPLIFDEGQQPKPAFWAILEAAKTYLVKN
jgi:endo-1,4-beta-xylanase